MKYFSKKIPALLVVLATMISCDLGVQIKPSAPESPEGNIVLKVTLPSSLNGKEEDSYNTVRWLDDDQPVLVQISADGTHSAQLPVSASVSEGADPVFTYELPRSEGEFNYWVSRPGKGSDNVQLEDISAWTLEIPSVQTPELGSIDPHADVLVSAPGFAMNQEYVSGKGLAPQMDRLNAVIALDITGVPEDHSLDQLVLRTDEFITGKQKYDIKEYGFTEGAERTTTLTLNFKDAVRTSVEEDGHRRVWCSVWPETIGNYSFELRTLDEKGQSHMFHGKPVPFAPAIEFKAQCLTEWPVLMRDVKEKPVLPPTPAGPEGVIHGKEGKTLDLFRKIKAYKDNGISMVDDWWTHQMGYEGVTIHEAKVIQYGEPVHLWVLEADPSKVGFALGTPYDSEDVPPPSFQTVSGQASYAVKAGKKVIAAVNGDAWGASGGNFTYGVMYKDGFCLKKWAAYPNDIANTDTFYADDAGNVGIVDEEGFRQLVSSSNVETAIGGWYRLISQGGEAYAQSGAKDGDPLLRDKNKTSGSLHNFLERHPRTFMGISEDRVYIVAADGRQPSWSVGLTLNACARILYSLGCRRGINFDGGGSTAMVKKSGSSFQLLNKPSDYHEREVANSLLVIAR